MKPSKSILDRSFVYVSSGATSVGETWRRFGWRTAAESGRRREAPRRVVASTGARRAPK